jgi:hypothetical protein
MSNQPGSRVRLRLAASVVALAAGVAAVVLATLRLLLHTVLA